MNKFQKIKIDRNIKQCPYCGCEEYYRKESYKGNREFRIRFDGQEADNSDMWDGAIEKITSKYAWCCDCHRRLFKLEE